MVKQLMARLIRRKKSLIAAPSFAPDWTPDYATGLKKFLSSEEGRVLMARARALECKLALDACTKKAISPDRAAGFSDAVNWLESLSQISGASPVQDATTEPRFGEDEMPVINELAFTH